MRTVPDALAAIDVGTNSFHLVVARPSAGGGFDVIAREKETVRLGHGGGDMKRLEQDAMDRGIAALTRMRKIAEISNAPVRAVATSAVREADNHDVFIDRARREAGVDVEVISGIEEARLIHLGVLQALPIFDRRLFLCDIGGGSTELLIGEHGTSLAARSLKLGAVRLTDRFFTGNDHRQGVDNCRDHVRSLLWAFHREATAHGFEVAVASSGTAETIIRMALVARGEVAPRSLNAATATAAEIRGVVGRLERCNTNAERGALPGMDPKRSDIIMAGALVLEGWVNEFGIDVVTFSDGALREGVLLDTLQRVGDGSLHHLRDLSRQSVRNLAALCDEEPAHSERVARFALDLFDATRDLHGLDDGCREYLEAAALLANVGLFVSHSKHHLHSYYVIRNSERLVGFTDSEIEVIAQIARYHRKSAPKMSHREFAALRPSDQHVVRALAGILRVAIGLDRSHEGRVVGLSVQRDGQDLQVLLQAEPGADISLELYAANERRELLSSVLGLDVEVAAR